MKDHQTVEDLTKTEKKSFSTDNNNSEISSKVDANLLHLLSALILCLESLT